jgi:predicted acyl esterase
MTFRWRQSADTLLTLHTLRAVRPRARLQPLAPGQVVQADIALGPSATLFKAGETLRLVIAGRWLWPVNPLTGQFPAAYQKAPTAAAPCTSARSFRPACSSLSSPDPALARAPARES